MEPPRYLKKTLDAIKLVQAGLSPKQALQATNCKTEISGAAVSKFREKLKKYSLCNPSTAHLAENQIKRILRNRAREEAHTKVTKDGEVIEYTDNIYPTDSNILAAAQMVYDRYDPVRSESGDQGPGNTYIELDVVTVYPQAGEQAQAIDIIQDDK